MKNNKDAFRNIDFDLVSTSTLLCLFALNLIYPTHFGVIAWSLGSIVYTFVSFLNKLSNRSDEDE